MSDLIIYTIGYLMGLLICLYTFHKVHKEYDCTETIDKLTSSVALLVEENSEMRNQIQEILYKEVD